MYKTRSRHAALAVSLLALATLSSCIWLVKDVEVRPVSAALAPVVVETPVRVHLKSGRNAVFMGGATIDSQEIAARASSAQLFDVDLSILSPVSRISMDSVTAVETYGSVVNSNKTAAVSLLATGALVASPFLAKAIFGSCPTVYSFENGAPVLDAESFSNSIASMFEQRDVDRVRAQASPDGFVELEIRNEALETHYINHLELIEVQHSGASVALPGPDGMAYVLDGLIEPSRAVDRAGRDIRPMLLAQDDDVVSTDPSILAAASPDDLSDYIDLTFPAPPGDSAAVILHLRNSLLNTVFFYEFMLAGQGARSLDWLGRDLESISHAVGLGDFFARHMGLRIQVWEGSTYRQVGRVHDVGPIAWDRVAVPVPASGSDSLHIRLHFVADAWRIDEVTLATEVRTVTPRRVPAAHITSPSARGPADPLEVVSKSDEAYLVTMPGTWFRVKFDVGTEPEDGKRTFLLAAQGYYTEWIRRDWLEKPATAEFALSTSSLYAAIQRWREVKSTYEATFASSKIPVR